MTVVGRSGNSLAEEERTPPINPPKWDPGNCRRSQRKSELWRRGKECGRREKRTSKETKGRSCQDGDVDARTN